MCFTAISGCGRWWGRPGEEGSHAFWERQLFHQAGREAWRGDEGLELLPALFGVFLGAAPRLDEITHHIFSQVVIDDVASILIVETNGLLGNRKRPHRITSQPLGGLLGIELAVQVPAGSFVPP